MACPRASHARAPACPTAAQRPAACAPQRASPWSRATAVHGSLRYSCARVTVERVYLSARLRVRAHQALRRKPRLVAARDEVGPRLLKAEHPWAVSLRGARNLALLNVGVREAA